uniref:medium-chain acyl-CoA ligase n=1 Tax=Mustela putorius furo TaxID=9669 RepID=M3YP11_MUSPF
QAGERPANPALWWVNGKGDEVKWSFEELGSLSRKAANVLTDPCGLKRGDRVAVILPHIPDWWLVNVACMRTELLVPTEAMLTKNRKIRVDFLLLINDNYYIKFLKKKEYDCGNQLESLCLSFSLCGGEGNLPILMTTVFTDHQDENRNSLEPISNNNMFGSLSVPGKFTHPERPSYVFYFSISFRYWLDLKSSDIMWNMSDTGWIKAAIGSVFSTWLQGACVFVHRMAQFDTDTLLDNIKYYIILKERTEKCLTNALNQSTQKECLFLYKFKKLRHCLTGGEPLNPEVLEQWEAQTGLELYEGYGQTEVGIICANQKGQEIKQGSMGKGVLPYDVQIIDENGNILPPGKEGEIALRPKSTRPFCFFSEYVVKDVQSTSHFIGDFYTTGDRGVMDSDGYFWFVGRADDVIISSGYRIGPFEVESALIEHPAVVESAVVSSPDPVRGEVVKAFVVLSAPFKSSNPEKLILELQDHVKKSTAPYKYPRKVEFVPELPKTVTGKIKRNVLRDHEWGRT